MNSHHATTATMYRWMVTVIVLLVLALGINCKRIHTNEYQVLGYQEGGTHATATLRTPERKILEIECYGSLLKGTDLSSPGYRTDPNKPGTWEGAVGTDHWMFGCRPLPIGESVIMVREKYPANYLD